jgi:bifunctional UDP-N-acetylglucosamine pyrophosphorylase/glucosamine-1-phosphate N-acetyltransferase
MQSLYSFQEEQLGTAHAVKWQSEHLSTQQGTTLVVCGDTPLITAETLKSLIEHHEKIKLKLQFYQQLQPNPFGYGRIV